MSAPPALSVCIPAYNGERFVEASLRSVLQQDLPDLEVLLFDDCSTDSTFEIASSIKDERLKVARNPRRLGLTGNWNRCVDAARGDLICIWHQDDLMLPGNLQAKIEAMEDPSAGFVYSQVEQIDGSGTAVEGNTYWREANPSRDTEWPAPEGFEHMFSRDNLICCPSVVARRACFTELGGFDTRLRFCVDWEMWMRISLRYTMRYLATPLIAYRWHEAQETNRFVGAVDEARERYLAKKIAIESDPDHVRDATGKIAHLRSSFSEEFALRARHAIDAGKTKDALKLLALSIRLSPGSAASPRSRKVIRTVVGRTLRRNR